MELQPILDFIQGLPPGVYTGGVSLLIVLAVQRFKKWVEREQEKNEWLYVLVSTTLAFLAELGQYAAVGGQDWTALGPHTATVLGVISLIYHFPRIGVKAMHKIIEDAKNASATPALAAAPVNPDAPTILDGEFTGR